MTETPDPPEREPVGTVAEEAAKLLGAMGDWAREHGTPGWTDGLAGGWGALAHDVDEHIANGEDCRYCPLCRGIQVVRAASPEVRDHLASAISSLAQAATAYLSTSPADDRAAGVEHIDLSDEWPEDET
jgi:hypothetical protein